MGSGSVLQPVVTTVTVLLLTCYMLHHLTASPSLRLGFTALLLLDCTAFDVDDDDDSAAEIGSNV